MRIDIDTNYLVKLYTVDHLTLREIGKQVKLSAPGVNKRLRKAGITSEQCEHCSVICDFCGKEFDRTRKRAKAVGAKYCSMACYSAGITSPKSHIWRHGQRLARLIVAQHFDLQPNHVVHHIDGDDRNNDRSNLAVYVSQADHTSAHRGGKATPICVGI